MTNGICAVCLCLCRSSGLSGCVCVEYIRNVWMRDPTTQQLITNKAIVISFCSLSLSLVPLRQSAPMTAINFGFFFANRMAEKMRISIDDHNNEVNVDVEAIASHSILFDSIRMTSMEYNIQSKRTHSVRSATMRKSIFWTWCHYTRYKSILVIPLRSLLIKIDRLECDEDGQKGQRNKNRPVENDRSGKLVIEKFFFLVSVLFTVYSFV